MDSWPCTIECLQGKGDFFRTNILGDTESHLCTPLNISIVLGDYLLWENFLSVPIIPLDSLLDPHYSFVGAVFVKCLYCMHFPLPVLWDLNLLIFLSSG